jgi:glycosyltransferase involved in cell wall biosynthesis
MEVEPMNGMQEPFFSIVVPTRQRVSSGRLQRCLTSIATQTFGNFEALIVDDGSDKINEDVESLVKKYDGRFEYVGIEHSGRIIARNEGMSRAKGQWIVWCDDDDMLNPLYLKTFVYHIQGQPEVKLWVGGVVYHGMFIEAGVHLVPKWTKIRPAWKPPLNKPEDRPPVHKFFSSGKVGTGMFVFAAECLEKTGVMPPWVSIYDLADGIHEWTGYVMDPPFYSAAKKWVGNPWGDDHAMFLKLCRYYEAHPIGAALYTQFCR